MTPLGVDADWVANHGAAASGSMELLLWLDERGAKWTEPAFCDAAEGGSEEVLEWLVAHGCPMPVGVVADEVGVVLSNLVWWGAWLLFA